MQINPPFYAPLVEVVPAPYTNPSVTDTTMAIMKEIGQSPVLLKKEIEGFAVNRVQCAILNECWRLVQVCTTRLLSVPERHGCTAGDYRCLITI